MKAITTIELTPASRKAVVMSALVIGNIFVLILLYMLFLLVRPNTFTKNIAATHEKPVGIK